MRFTGLIPSESDTISYHRFLGDHRKRTVPHVLDLGTVLLRGVR